MSIFAEFKRRNVFRVGLAYLVLGWKHWVNAVPWLPILDTFTSESGTNNTGFANTRFDETMIKLAPETADSKARLAFMQEAEAILLRAGPIIPLYTYNSKHLMQPSVKGAPANVLDVLNYKYISLDPEVPVWKSGK